MARLEASRDVILDGIKAHQKPKLISNQEDQTDRQLREVSGGSFNDLYKNLTVCLVNFSLSCSSVLHHLRAAEEAPVLAPADNRTSLSGISGSPGTVSSWFIYSHCYFDRHRESPSTLLGQLQAGDHLQILNYCFSQSL